LLGIGKSDTVFSNIVQQQQQQQTDTAEIETAVPSDSASILHATTPATTAATVISATDRPLTYREEMQNGVAAIARQRIQGLQGGVVSLFSAVVGQRTAAAAASAAAANTPMIEQSSSTGVATSAATSSLGSSAHGTTTAATDKDSSSSTNGSSSAAAAASSGSAMTAETVTALSKKLTHAEMRGIISLTDRLKRMNQTATQSQVM
jgi:hypothetical protein